MDTVIPGIDPWNAVLANPYIWHFAFHSIPELPETLVAEHLPEYLGYFFDVITAVPDAITPEARRRYVEAYSAPAALRQGFEFYRALPGDAEANAGHSVPIDIPLLYLRGTAEGGEMDDYATGFRAAGIRHLQTGMLEGSGHFAPEEAPDQVWDRIAAFAPVE